MPSSVSIRLGATADVAVLLAVLTPLLASKDPEGHRYSSRRTGSWEHALVGSPWGGVVGGFDAVLSRVDTASAQHLRYEIDRVLFESTASPHGGVSTIGRLSGGLMLSRDRIVLADAMAKSLLFVDLESGGTDVVGRQGEGPGEFRMLRSIGRTASGDVFADDPHGARVTVFGTDGSLVETVGYNPVDFRGFVWIPQPIGVHADGTVIFRDSDPMFTERPNGPYREKIDYLALKPDGERVRIAEADGRELVRRNYPDSRYAAFEKPFSYSAIDAVVGDLVIVGDTESGVLSAYDRSGDVVVEFDYGRGVEISSEHDRLWRERKVAQEEPLEIPVPEGTPANLAGLLGGIGAAGDAEAEFYRTAEANPTAPSFSRMVVDGEGRVWVQRYMLPGEDEARWSRWRLDEGWDRMEAVVLPRAHELLDASGERVLLRATDELGVERAVVATLRVMR